MTIYFVDPAGDDGNPGTEALPFETIGHGLFVLASGDTLNIRAGTYDEYIWESMVPSGTPSSPTTVQAYLAEAVTLRPTTQCVALRFNTTAKSDIVIRGLELDQSLATCSTEPVASIDSNQSDIVLDALKIHDGAANGLEIDGDAILVQDCTVYDCGGHGILIGSSATNCSINAEAYGNGSDGVSSGSGGSGNTVEKSNCHGNTGGGILIDGTAPTCINCLAWSNGGVGIKIGGSATDAKVYHASVYDSGSYGIHVDTGAEDTLLTNDASYGNTGAAIQDDGTSTVQTTNLTASDPKWNDPDNGEFWLGSDSPAIDQGTDLTSEGVTDDFSGEIRPIDDGYDIGAYEYNSGSTIVYQEGAGLMEGSGALSGVGGGQEGAGTMAGVGSLSGSSVIQGGESDGLMEGLGSLIGRGLLQFPDSGIGGALGPVNPKDYVLRATDCRIGANGIIEYDLVREDPTNYSGVISTPLVGDGTIGGAPPPPAPPLDEGPTLPGVTKAVLMDGPLLRAQDDGPGFYVAANGVNAGWRGAVIYEKVGDDYVEVASLNNRTVMGVTTTKLLDGDVTLFDESGRQYQFDDSRTVDVTLLDEESVLTSVSDNDLYAGTNIAAIGIDGRWEIVAFGVATQTDTKKYTLSHLLRGLKGSEWATGTHQKGDTFVLLSQTMRRVPDESTDIGQSRQFRAVSVGNDFEDSPDISFTDTGVSQKPLSPCYLRGEEDGDSNKTVRFNRRSRLDGLAGLDTYDPAPPLGETIQQFEMDIYNAAFTSVLRTLSSTTEFFNYSAVDQATDFGSPPSTLNVCIYQMSELLGRGYGACETISVWDSITSPPTGDGGGGTETKIYNVAVTFPQKPNDGATVLTHEFRQQVVFAAGLTDSGGVIDPDNGVVATSSAQFSIRKNGTQVGTATFAASATLATFAMASDVTYNPGDVMTILAPGTQDITLQGFGFTIVGTRT